MSNDKKPLPKAGEKVEIERFVSLHKYDSSFYFTEHDASEFGHALLGKATISFIMPNGDPVKSMVKSLEKAIEKEKAESHVRICELKEKIQQLLAIGHDGGES